MDNDFSRMNDRNFARAQADYETPPDYDDGPAADDVLAITWAIANDAAIAQDESKAALAQGRSNFDRLFAIAAADALAVYPWADDVEASVDLAAKAARAAVRVASAALGASLAACKALKIDQGLGDDADADAEVEAAEALVELYDDVYERQQTARRELAACKGFATAAAKVTRVLVDEGGFPWAAPDLPPDAPRPWDVIPRGEYTIDGIIELSKRIADASGRAVIAAGRARSAVAPYVTERADLVSEAVDAAAAAIEALRATRIAGENCARMIHRAKAAEIEKDGDEFFKAFAQAEGLVDDADRAVADAIASADLAEKLVGEYLLDPSNANPPDKTYTDFIRETHQ